MVRHWLVAAGPAGPRGELGRLTHILAFNMPERRNSRVPAAGRKRIAAVVLPACNDTLNQGADRV